MTEKIESGVHIAGEKSIPDKEGRSNAKVCGTSRCSWDPVNGRDLLRQKIRIGALSLYPLGSHRFRFYSELNRKP